MKFGTSLSLRRMVEDEIDYVVNDVKAVNEAVKAVKEVENEKTKKKRGRKKKADKE